MKRTEDKGHPKGKIRKGVNLSFFLLRSKTPNSLRQREKKKGKRGQGWREIRQLRLFMLDVFELSNLNCQPWQGRAGERKVKKVFEVKRPRDGDSCVT